MYSNLGETNKAIENYNDAIEIDSMFYPAMINLAMMYNRTGDNEAAEKLFVNIIQKFPELTDTYYSLGLLLAEDKKYSTIVKLLERKINKWATDIKLNVNLYNIENTLEDIDKETLEQLKSLGYMN